VQLWVNSDARRGTGVFRQFYPDSAESHDTEISGNNFVHNDFAVRGWTERDEFYVAPRCHHFRVTDNTISGNRVGVQFERVRDSAIYQNNITGNLEAGIKLIGCVDVSATGNEM
jgi:parallel beta-helix repeat protein